MNTKKVDNEQTKITIKTVPGYEHFTQVTTAGDVIEIIRNSILYHHVESVKPYQDKISVKRHCNKRHGLEMLLDAIILNEAKMCAWQDMKGPKPLKECGDQYKQLANGEVYYHDNSGGSTFEQDRVKAPKAQQDFEEIVNGPAPGIEAVDKGDYLEVDLS